MYVDFNEEKGKFYFSEYYENSQFVPKQTKM